MKWISATVTFDASDRGLATDLVADIFYSLCVKGVVVDEPDQDPLQDWGDNAVPPPEKPGVTGYFPDTSAVAEQCRILEAKLERLQRKMGITTAVTYARIDEQDWAEAWKEYFWPEKITDRIVVKPTWRDYTTQPDELVIEIDPGMAFGTGTHPSTALCIRMIEAYLEPGDCFLDVGTGSGILSIAAAKLGAGRIIGVDNDEVAVSVAEKNLLVNHINKNSYKLFCGNLVDQVSQTVDLLAANILAEVILELLPDVSAVLRKGGLFISSGIVTEKKEIVLSCLAKNQFTTLQVMEKEGWMAIAARNDVQ
jgi:ribosomal protein L11 methyltransferase